MVPDYLSASADLRRGAADVAYLSPLLTCKTLRWDPEVRYLATARIKADGSSHYEAVVFARAEAGVTTLAEARGLPLGLVNEESAAGYHFPLARLVSLGIEPGRHFRKLYLLGTHQAVVSAVGAGTLPVGAAYGPALTEFGTGTNFVVLARSEPIPASSLLATPYAPASLIEALQGALRDPAYEDAVPGAGALVYDDHGWQALAPGVVDAPCAVAARLRAAQKLEPGR